MGSRVLATAGVMTMFFLAAMDLMAVAPALPTVESELGGVKLHFLVFSVYLVASTVTVPLWGRLSDIYGRLRFVVTGIVVFLGGSALCGLSQSIEALILFRGLQGLGAGAVMTLGFTMLADMFELEKRAKMQGLMSSVWGLASIVGPIVGGYITEHLSWRYVFYINIPIGIVAIAIIVAAWRFEPKQRRQHSLDLPGMSLFTLSMCLLLLGLALISKGD
ncbi:MAG: MFS transporter [Planctomycetota bacterium]|jgi:MFS family permease